MTRGTSCQQGKIVYAILAHSRKTQLLRLMRVLREESPSCSIVLHWDRSQAQLEQEELNDLGDIYVVEDLVAAEWGDWSIVAATLRTLRTALSHTSFDWIVLLSGQDYPVSPLREIEAELINSGFDAHIDIGQVASAALAFQWRRAQGTRLGRRYYFAYAPLPHLHLRLPRKIRGALVRALLMISEYQPLLSVWPMPSGVRWRIGVRRFRTPFSSRRPCRVGGAWMSLSHRCAERVIRRVDEDRTLPRYYRRTIIPDESFFQTIISAEPDLKVCADNHRFQLWSKTDSPLHPEIIGREELELALRSRKHFARKFDEAADPGVLDLVDEHRRCHRNEGN